MSLEIEDVTAESILTLIEQLPSTERARLNQMLTKQKQEPSKAKAPLDKRVPARPMPDRTSERQWVKDHKHEYAGQWVALDGDRLIAAGPIQQEVWDAVSANSEIPPLVLRIPSPDDLPFMGI